MLKSPVNRDPSRPPRLEPNVFRPRGVPAEIEHVKVLPRKNVPIAVEKCAPQMFRQRFQRPPVLRVVRVNRIVINARANEIVVARIVQAPAARIPAEAT